MRPLTKLLLVLLISMLLMTSRIYAGSIDTVKHTGPKMKDLFVYKTNKKFLGATVEILSSRGNVITSSQLNKRKLVIDFGEVHLGTYTIRVSKGNEKAEYVYIKK